MSVTLLYAGIAPVGALQARLTNSTKSERNVVSNYVSRGGYTRRQRVHFAPACRLQPGFFGTRLALPTPRQRTPPPKVEGTQASISRHDDIAALCYFSKNFILPLLPRLALATGISVAVCVAHDAGIFAGINQVGHTALGTLVSFLLVFRCQLAYSRYWEGGAQLTEAISSINNICIKVHTIVQRGEEGRAQRTELARLLRLYFTVVVQSLRVGSQGQGREQILSNVVYSDATPEEQRVLTSIPRAELIAGCWLSERILQVQMKPLYANAPAPQSAMLQGQLLMEVAKLAGHVQACFRISSTPFPRSYANTASLLIQLLVFTFPAALVPLLSWYTVPLEVLLAMAYFGLVDIATLLEDPFGTDVEDYLKDDLILQRVYDNIKMLLESEELMNTI